jgi:hypothetical protein
MYMLFEVSIKAYEGDDISALLACPPLPLLPIVPVPTTVLMMPDQEEILRTA